MFQAEYSSGQPLRMLVDLRASVDGALGRASGAADGQAAKAAVGAAAAAGAAGSASVSNQPGADRAHVAAAKPASEVAPSDADAAEFEVSAEVPDWSPDSQPGEVK
jgi:hypothetical protein